MWLSVSIGMFLTDTPFCALSHPLGEVPEASPESSVSTVSDGASISVSLLYDCQNSGGNINKDVESISLSVPLTEALALPLELNRQRKSPRRYEYSNPLYWWYERTHSALSHICKRDAYKHIPRTSTVARLIFQIWSCEFQLAMSEASSKRLFYVWSLVTHPSALGESCALRHRRSLATRLLQMWTRPLLLSQVHTRIRVQRYEKFL